LELLELARAIQTHPAPEVSKTIQNFLRMELPWDRLYMSNAF
jgi:hypothetical protein